MNESHFVDDDPWFIDERDLHDPDVDAFFADRDGVVSGPVDDAVVAAMNDLEMVTVRQRMLIAEQYRAINSILCDAEADPESWVGPDPTIDPDWTDPRERSAAAVRRERREFAVRAAAADIAVRLRMSESVVRTRAERAAILKDRMPRLWASFLGGAVCEQNAVVASQLASSLPDDGEAWDAFDQRVWEFAGRLTPPKFRVRARVARERVHPESTPEVCRTAGVAVTIPVLTLLGESDEPAILHEYGPIDRDTARRLAGDASSWVRMLTHPVTGTVLDVDRRTYRVPADLRRWLGVAHPTCVFPGCSRPARDCDVDHRVDWQHGGTTSAENLAPECESHHRLKHGSLWKLERDPDAGAMRWVSPSGHEADADPPPF
ncbi:HNH endonuclease signature motif containing protein [Microbacterium immunditiarum]|uniref:HNH nuclease domain-containing protein n=1 Tax=Microbacterium immunditiarum TaxID=337480 RepID=A0A7Y9KHX4_9MICO|nr:HNH endonuclease signature motif containing protein [Microbacterium immunditiarum]NYE19957.1 hypothetical protein [Microbacterium immunditiarum]